MTYFIMPGGSLQQLLSLPPSAPKRLQRPDNEVTMSLPEPNQKDGEREGERERNARREGTMEGHINKL